jgi:hypothetical protein
MVVASNDLGFKQVCVCVFLGLIVGWALLKMGVGKDTATYVGNMVFAIVLAVWDLSVRFANVREREESVFHIFTLERGGVAVLHTFMVAAGWAFVVTQAFFRK